MKIGLALIAIGIFGFIFCTVALPFSAMVAMAIGAVGIGVALFSTKKGAA